MKPPTFRYYDHPGRRLVYLRRRADAAYWESHWMTKDAGVAAAPGAGNAFFADTTAAFLPSGSRVLDGGCGMGDKVAALGIAGFEAYGVDLAAETAARALRVAPGLKLIAADVRSLPFKDGFLDGYWSIGVIEHFYEGFEQVVEEMRRVIRPGGFLFVTFPSMSPFRRMLASLGWYRAWTPASGSAPEDFYQFALPPRQVEEIFSRMGFDVMARGPHGGIRGVQEDLPFMHPLLRRAYRRRHRRNEKVRAALDRLLAPCVGHTFVLTLRRRAI